MRKNFIAFAVVLVVLSGGIGFTLAGSNTFTLGKHAIRIEKGAEHRESSSLHRVAIGRYDEVIYEDKNGKFIIPPKKDSAELHGYIAQRRQALKNYAKKNPSDTLEAMITFKKPLTPEEFNRFMTSYGISKRFVQGAKEVNGRTYYMASGYDKVLAVDVTGEAQELLKIQRDSRVLLVDMNIGSEHHLRVP